MARKMVKPRKMTRKKRKKRKKERRRVKAKVKKITATTMRRNCLSCKFYRVKTSF